jgi:hypothetical protein
LISSFSEISFVKTLPIQSFKVQRLNPHLFYGHKNLL